MSETALIVPVYEAESAIDLIRRRHTRSGAEGVPPHVTLLYPFADSAVLVAGRIHEVEDVLSGFRPFPFELTSVAFFDGAPRTMYLTPTPDAPFVEMTRALTAAFPEHLPYGGKHSSITPHVTVAVADDATLAELEAEVAAKLPLEGTATCALLMQRDDGNRWFEKLRIDLTG